MRKRVSLDLLREDYWKSKSSAVLNNLSRRLRENSEMLARGSLIVASFTNPEAKISVCVSFSWPESGHVPLGAFFAVGSRCCEPQ